MYESVSSFLIIAICIYFNLLLSRGMRNKNRYGVLNIPRLIVLANSLLGAIACHRIISQYGVAIITIGVIFIFISILMAGLYPLVTRSQG